MSSDSPSGDEHGARSARVRRLGKNHGGYCGETIDLPAVLREIEESARTHGWTREVFLDNNAIRLFALSRAASRTPNTALRVYISTGIHGDEPAGPLAARQLVQENQWPDNVSLWLCPCLNPAGFVANRRENREGVDLNREYLHPKARETSAHMAWLHRQPAFDLSLCLHEDWESHGFYLYELNPDHRPSLAEDMVARIAEVCPVDHSDVIEGRPAQGGIIRPVADPRSRPDWPEAFFLLTYKTRISYTLEAPSDFSLPIRVAALVAGVRAALAKLNRCRL